MTYLDFSPEGLITAGVNLKEHLSKNPHGQRQGLPIANIAFCQTCFDGSAAASEIWDNLPEIRSQLVVAEAIPVAWPFDNQIHQMNILAQPSPSQES